MSGKTTGILALVRTARHLEDGGADLIVIPCNTAHYFYGAVQCSVRVPVLHMMRVTSAYLRERYPAVRTVGLPGTTGTVRAGRYQDSLAEQSRCTLVPDEAGQAVVMDCIYGEHGVKAGHAGPDATARLVQVAGDLIGRGAASVVAGCTELPLVLW